MENMYSLQMASFRLMQLLDKLLPDGSAYSVYKPIT